MSRRGWFISFEGVDGSGKTTQMRRFAAHLRANGREVIETVEPGGTPIGTQIRRILLDPANHNLASTAEVLLYFAARAQNVEEIVVPATARGAIVISDRWTDSSYAYQGHGRALGGGMIEQLDHIACQGRRPDVTLWIDVELEASLTRARSRNADEASNETRMDDQARAFYERVVEGYRELAVREPERVLQIDGNGTLDEVAQRVMSTFERWESAHA